MKFSPDTPPEDRALIAAAWDKHKAAGRYQFPPEQDIQAVKANIAKEIGNTIEHAATFSAAPARPPANLGEELSELHRRAVLGGACDQTIALLQAAKAAQAGALSLLQAVSALTGIAKASGLPEALQKSPEPVNATAPGAQPPERRPGCILPPLLGSDCYPCARGDCPNYHFGDPDRSWSKNPLR